MQINREPIVSAHAPAALGPYSQAIRTEHHIFASGQLGLDPANGTLREGVEAQTQQCLENLSAVLEAAGSSLGDVVKTTIFLADMADFGAVNAVYAEAFHTSPPARSTVQVAALPLGGLVEIEAIALVNA